MRYIENKTKIIILIFIAIIMIIKTANASDLIKLEKEFYLSVNGAKEYLVKTNKNSLKDILKEHGFNEKNSIIQNDRNDDNIYPGDLIRINTKKKIIFNSYGKNKNVYTYSNTIRDFLKEHNITPDDNDIISPSYDTLLSSVKNVTFVQIDEELYQKEKDVKFEKKIKYSQDLDLGDKKIIQEGKNGKKVIGSLNILSNGKKIKEIQLEESITQKPVSEITLIGTRKKIEKSIPFETIKKSNFDIYIGNNKILQKGKAGKEIIEYNVKNDKQKLISKTIIKDPVSEIIEIGAKIKKKSVPKTVIKKSMKKSTSLYTLRDLKFQGVINWSGYKFTYYSQRVLPGGALRIPGRHINSGGYVADKDGYIVLANSAPNGTVINTPFSTLR